MKNLLVVPHAIFFILLTITIPISLHPKLFNTNGTIPVGLGTISICILSSLILTITAFKVNKDHLKAITMATFFAFPILSLGIGTYLYQ